MEYFEPDFYGKFSCIADKCEHSCCMGWEIDIDEDSYELYKNIKGSMGDELRAKTSAEPEPHFLLEKDERCPFLNEKGLCRLILNLGEDCLCDICAEHPRFYNYYSNREERGLGLCCEEAVRLLLSEEKPLKIIKYSKDDWNGDYESADISLRDRLLSLLGSRSKGLSAEIKECLELTAASCRSFDASFWAEFLLSLEQMDAVWTGLLKKLLSEDIKPMEEKSFDSPRYERLLSYIIYRQFCSLERDFGAAAAIIFCAFSTAFIYTLDMQFGPESEHIRLWSSEIEYSVENIQLICDKIIERQQ